MAGNVKLKKENATLKAQIDSLKKELVVFKVECAVSKAETKATLGQMKSIVVDTTLHAKAKLMEEFKARQHADWDPNYDIRV